MSNVVLVSYEPVSVICTLDFLHQEFISYNAKLPFINIMYQVLQFTWSFRTSCIVDLINISGRKSFYIVDLLYLAFAVKNGIKLNSSE